MKIACIEKMYFSEMIIKDGHAAINSQTYMLLVSMVAAALKAQPIDPDIINMIIYILNKQNHTKKIIKKISYLTNFGPDPVRSCPIR